jgi:hypothetical protein
VFELPVDDLSGLPAILKTSLERISIAPMFVAGSGRPINALQVVAEAQRIRPGVRVVLMSAYSREMAPPSLNVPEVNGFISRTAKL